MSANHVFYPKKFGVGKLIKIIMTNTFTKISIVTALVVVVFGVLGYSLSANVFINEVSAQTTCGDCGGGSTGGGTEEGGGGDSTPAPTCDIKANITMVQPNGQYTISWVGGGTGATFKLGGSAVSATGSYTLVWNADNVFITYTLTGSNNGKTCSDTVTVYRQVEAPTCDITTNLSVVDVGGQYKVTWAGTPTHSTVFKVNGAVVNPTGSATYTYPNDGRSSLTFTMTGANAAGNCSDAVVITKRVVEVPTPTCDSFTSNLSSIVRGNSATLTWATTNADAVSITNVSGPFTVDGSKVVTPNVTTTYTLTATKGAKSVTCAVPVTVTDVPTPLDPICDSFTANPTTINRGQSTKLTWATTNAINVSINNAVGAVAVDGNIDVTPLLNVTYTLTATKDAKSVTCAVPVTVIQPENPTVITCATNVTNFSTNSSSIRRGESSILTWNTKDLTSVSFTNVNATGLSGSVTVSPSDSITYTLIGKKGSQTIECPVTVSVSTSNGGGGGGGSSSPTCKLTISDKNISLGERVTIKWDTSRATEVSLKDNHGKTLIDTDGKSSSAKKDLYDGEITLRPEKDTTYTLLAEKGSRDRSCKVEVNVEDTIVVTQVRDQQPLVTGIALTNVPYTGFEAGPFMTSVFYTLLAAWALYMAYVLVGRRNGMNASAFAPALVTTDTVPSTMMLPEKVTAAPVFYQAPAAVAALPVVTIGYEAHTEVADAIEAQAHAAHVLLSTDATQYFVAATAGEDRAAILASVITAAKASYPSEDGWVVISADRMVELAAKN